MAEKEKKGIMKGAAEFLLRADLVAGAALLLWGTITANLGAVAIAGTSIVGDMIGFRVMNKKSVH